MKKYIFLCLAIATYPKVSAQDAAVLVPYLQTMIMGLNGVSKAIGESEEQLGNIKKVLGKVKDINAFMENAMAVREAINTLICIRDHISEDEISMMLGRMGVQTNNVFSDFLQCQYGIYYSTLEMDYKLITSNIDRAFDVSEELNIAQRLGLINSTLEQIKSMHYRTVTAKGALLKLLQRHVEIKRAEEFYTLMNKI